ncbi:hypothetical protein TorRG33x02_187500 [Trema orientale]|uniref:Uncharacterized protein n=1 Tax=Trema orientale TaxID=63057 RepID=A0A2P5EIT6_TREOI|nr:hypothetical protein TorRG33x02_187500 [Trema orientale]
MDKGVMSSKDDSFLSWGHKEASVSENERGEMIMMSGVMSYQHFLLKSIISSSLLPSAPPIYATPTTCATSPLIHLSSSQNSNTSPTLLHVATTPAVAHPNAFDASTPDLVDYVKCPNKLPVTLPSISSSGFLSLSSPN